MKVIIVGGGPAGLFAAYELADFCDVTIIDKGRDSEKRICPYPNNCKKSCKPCNVVCGIGGAGLFSDGKIIFDTEVGTNLTEIIGLKKNKNLVEKVEKIFSEYSVFARELTNDEIALLNEIRKKASQADIKFVYTRQAHVGTNNLKDLISKFKNDLEVRGVEFLCKEEVKDIIPNENKIRTTKGVYKYDKLILAPGRVGASWLEKIVKKLGIKYEYSPIDIGVRVEVSREITDWITNLVRDMKFHMYLKNKIFARTFCTCPGGKVTKETHDDFVLVNGYSEKGDPGENTNFAFLIRISLTNPLSNTNEYGREVAALANTIGKGKIILQRLGDLRMEKRSKEKHKFNYLVKPTLDDVVYGDISLALPGKIIKNIVAGIERLNKVIPGVANDSTLLYAPEIKFHGLKIKTNKYLETNIKDIYVGGDGAGLSRGIAGAAACGVLIGEGIKKDMKKK